MGKQLKTKVKTAEKHVAKGDDTIRTDIQGYSCTEKRFMITHIISSSLSLVGWNHYRNRTWRETEREIDI